MKFNWRKQIGCVLAVSTLVGVPALFADDVYKETGKKEVTTAARTDVSNSRLPDRESLMQASAGAVIRGKTLIGMTIEDSTGKNVGEIQDVILDHSTGRAPFIIATLNKDYGIGSNYVALPFQALRFMGEKHNPILVADRAKIQSAQSFDKNHWPDFNDAKWVQATHEHYGYTWYGAKVAKPTDVTWTNRLSKLDDIAVKNPAGENLGEVEEIFIDSREGRVAYALVQFGGYLGLKEHNTLVPYTALKLDPANKVYILDVSKDALKAASFPEKAWPDYNDPTWGRQNAAHFNQEPYWETYGYAGDANTDAQHRDMATDYGYTRLFEGADNTTTVEGSIAAVDHYRINGDNNDGVRLKVQTSDGTYTWVDLGSQASFDRDHKMDFKTGEKVKVTGARAIVLRASKVQVGDQSFDANTKSLRSGMSNMKDDLSRQTREGWDQTKDQMKDAKDKVKDKLD